MGNEHSPESRNWASGHGHDEFLELCAISTTGELSQEEQAKLQEHFLACAECRQALEEFEAAAGIGAPLVSRALALTDTTESVPEALHTTESNRRDILRAKSPKLSDLPESADSAVTRRNGHYWSRMNWNYLWIPFAAAAVLVAAFGIYSFEAGARRGSHLSQAHSAMQTNGKLDALERQLSDAGHEREVLESQLTGRNRLIRELKHQVMGEFAALSEVKAAELKLQRTIQTDRIEKQQIAQEQNDLQRKLGAAEVALASTKAELDSAQQARREGQLDAKSLEAQIEDLNAQLRSREQKISEQDDLLADDRDIRDLMGARNLYIAEVYDVARDGKTRKPYGRIFYTRGKSLIFYAYDLDRQPGVKTASTFQAWGQRGPDRRQAVNLGIFYQDSVEKKRWVLKFDNPRTLAQINAVFVTVEPHGGSRKPDGKSLLFASLRIQPNHP